MTDPNRNSVSDAASARSNVVGTQAMDKGAQIVEALELPLVYAHS